MAEPSQNRERARPFRRNRQYFRWATPVGSAKARLSILFLLASLGWVAVAATSRERRNALCTHGPISKSHAPWADQCDACHVPFDGEKAGLFETRDRWNTFRCETCHAGPADSPKVYSPHLPGKTEWKHLNAEACSNCHKDHQGADFALAKPDDATCTKCHADLQRHHARKPDVPDINGFAAHPNFRVLGNKPEDIRSLKFNHAVHMAPGQGVKGPATLQCKSCHELDSAGSTRQSYLPVTFDKHCAACHDLNVGDKATLLKANLQPFRVTHKATAEQLKDELGQKFLSQLTAAQPKALTLEPKPGQRLDPPIPRVAESVRAEVDRLTAETLKELLEAGTRYCQKCHVSELASPTTLKKTDVHPVWLPAARFDHAKHRAMDCAGCHAEKFKPLSAPLMAKDELEAPSIPDIDNCRTCHAPAGKTAQGQPIGGVRHGCVDCHTYHHGDRRGLLGAEDLLRGLPRDTPR